MQRLVVQYFLPFLKLRTKTFGREFKYWLCVPTHTQEIAFAAKKQKNSRWMMSPWLSLSLCLVRVNKMSS